MPKNKLSVKAINKNVRSSSRKIALVLDYIRGKKADVALKDLDLITLFIFYILVELQEDQNV